MKKIFLILFVFMFTNSIFCNWRQVFFLDQGDFESISCPDTNNCFAIMNHPSTPVLFKSTDQGRNWFLIFEDNKKMNPSVVSGVSPNPAYFFIADDYYSTLRKSTDGGKTFKEIVLDNTAFGFDWTLRNLTMFDTNYGFASNSFSYFTTINGWESFVKHPKLFSDHYFYLPIFIDSNTVVMNSYITPPLDTHNHMAFMKYHLIEDKWDTLFYFGAEYKNWFDAPHYIFFINDSLGFACGRQLNDSLPDNNYYDIIYRTKNGGYNWELVHKEYVYPQIGFYNNISFADEKNGIAVGFYGKIAMTNDGGDTWVYEPHPNDMKNCRKMQVCWAGHTPLIGTWDAGIFRYEGDFFKFPEDTTGVEEKENYSSGNFNLSIYQKNGKLYISLEDEQFRKYKLQICDILGNIVQEEELQSGIGTLYIPYDISHLINGTYLWSISTAGVVAKTGKTIIMEN